MAEERNWLEGSNLDTAEQQLALFDRKSGPKRDKLDTGKKYTNNYRRILPQHKAMSSWGTVLATHYIGPEGSKTPMLCLRLMGFGECPACQYGFEILQTNKKAGAAILPNTKGYVNVVHVDENGELEDDTVYVLGLNKEQFADLKDVFDQYGDITHVETGRVINIRAKEEVSGNGIKFNKLQYAVTEPTPFPGDLAVLDGIYNLNEITPLYQASEMVGILEGRSNSVALLTSGDPFEDTKEETPKSMTFTAVDPTEDEGEEPDEEAPQAVSKPTSNPQKAIDRLKARTNGDA